MSEMSKDSNGNIQFLVIHRLGSQKAEICDILSSEKKKKEKKKSSLINPSGRLKGEIVL